MEEARAMASADNGDAREQLPKITLYWLNLSRSQRIVWLLEELKVPYEIKVFHRNKRTMLAPPELDKIHPLGKSPVVAVTPAGRAGGKEIVLAESGLMTQYLCEHLPEGKRLMPTRWREGLEGQIGGETEAWMRYEYLLHYAEGSLMPILVIALIMSRLKSTDVPFFIRPITAAAANRVLAQFVLPNAVKHMRLIDEMLATSGGRYLCGDSLTAADILMSFPLISGRDRWDDMGRWGGGATGGTGTWAQAFPRVVEYTARLEQEEGYKRSVERIEAVDGKFEASL